VLLEGDFCCINLYFDYKSLDRELLEMLMKLLVIYNIIFISWIVNSICFIIFVYSCLWSTRDDESHYWRQGQG
jgi:tryptophan-rich sensory protein